MEEVAVQENVSFVAAAAAAATAAMDNNWETETVTTTGTRKKKATTTPISKKRKRTPVNPEEQLNRDTGGETEGGETEGEQQQQPPIAVKKKARKSEKNSPLFLDNPSRFVMFPIQYSKLWELYKRAVGSFWRVEEIELSQDLVDWNTKLTTDERHFISMILAFFAASDGIVTENLAQRFMREVKLPEAAAFYGQQIYMEIVHNHTYSLLIDTYLAHDVEEKNRLFNAVSTIPCIQRKAEWTCQWIDDHHSSFCTRLVAFACVEGIFFSGAFCSIFWLKHRALMPGLAFSNELISRDEGLHCEFAVLLYNTFFPKHIKEKKVHQMVREAVEIESQFICDSLPCRLIGMNAELMLQYVQFVADRLVMQLGYKPIYHSENPFSFMTHISLEGKTNMFEKRISEYALAGAIPTMQETASFLADLADPNTKDF